ncbi:beta-ketoacyl-[acyl-carrier-protein] synthase family protein [candidate division WOR-3 bacterium]|uniref:Beta-ketoacyl-[acyl-carrier-protein] synthase family protein n=1 Tax=candidate division WOR-3 bacterium TaxID=2052148 RepID=A0A660SCB3_UNCW3|nr:MAG: beta-ketoacyl-[acyl-carrier-protein] synthase family protein [candidate division WOR-3 bacterium]
MVNRTRIVITGIGLTAPNGNNLAEFRQNLLAGKSGVGKIETHYMGEVIAGVCDFDPLKYQKKKELRRGTRAGSIAIYCASEAIADAQLDLASLDKSRIGVYLGITEHGNVETENEVYNIKQYDYNVDFWSHHHNPRTVANSPAGEVTLNMGITGPHYTLGAACAAGNIGIIQGMQMLLLGEVDLALAGGVSETPRTFGVFAAFKNEGALANHPDPQKASRPFDRDRNGIVVSEGGCICVLERLDDALRRGAKIYGEIAGYAINSDAFDFILPDPERQAECMRLALKKAGLSPGDIDIINTHATATYEGDKAECKAIREVFGDDSNAYINNTKSYIGHTMGAAGALELVGNLPSFEDHIVHQTINVDNLDPECALKNLVINEPIRVDKVDYILNNSFGMLGINSVLIVKRYEE